MLYSVTQTINTTPTSHRFRNSFRNEFPGGSYGKESACSAGDLGLISWLEDPLEKGMANHSGVLAWRIPWTEKPEGLQSVRLQGV